MSCLFVSTPFLPLLVGLVLTSTLFLADHRSHFRHLGRHSRPYHLCDGQLAWRPRCERYRCCSSVSSPSLPFPPHLTLCPFLLSQRMGYPSMAIAACFGGPMLNILLGVGLSGTYLILVNSTPEYPQKPIHIDMGRTLLVSGVGLFAILLGSLVVVPLNNYRMSKRVGACLIGAYTVRPASSLPSLPVLTSSRRADRPLRQHRRRGFLLSLPSLSSSYRIA